ncbi:MAG: PEP/pyruvate-binding domain-containing protein [Candidatus Saccharimonadales bacterium]
MNIVPLAEAEDATLYGGKAVNLGKVIRAGLPVPDGIAVGLTAFDGLRLKSDAKRQIEEYLEDDKMYAVRSSALAEDAEGASWAGQFESFLNTAPKGVSLKVEECHNSARDRAQAYASEQRLEGNFEVAVVVQEMLKPEYAGVLFTQDPVSGREQFITEYVAGLGEELVSGRVDPVRVVLDRNDVNVPFDRTQLVVLASKVGQLFGVPQDIEWAWADNKIWLLQARPITTTWKARSNYYLGEPDELFYWGPSRATPMYMSEFMAAIERVMKQMVDDPNLPTPPRNLVLFYKGSMIWLSNAKDFFDWCERVFETYVELDQLDRDIAGWQAEANKLGQLSGKAFNETAIGAWCFTEMAELSLYGSELALTKRLSRFDDETRHLVWDTFTVPDKPVFMMRLDQELSETRSPLLMAKKYPWIQDGYSGLSNNAEQYFKDRLKVVNGISYKADNREPKRRQLITKLDLSETEVKSLTLARKLAEFMDDRKVWMMQTRRLLKRSVGNIEHGWFFDNGEITLIGEIDTRELWQRYVDFKSSSSAVAGVVASNGSKHFVSGEVVVVNSPTDNVEDGKIVVVPFTSPSYVPLMRKAKALVTDHGGMMSHTAIVAREFNLPCIVGTKQATKVLQNSDKVVLDLVTGEIIK